MHAISCKGYFYAFVTSLLESGGHREKKSQNGRRVSHLTLFYTRGLEIVVLHVMVSQPYRFSLAFFALLPPKGQHSNM